MLRARKQAAGFSLVELLISLAIIGIMSAAIAPSIGEMVADNRQASAAIDLVRMSRKARALAIATGTAYMLRYQAGASGLGVLELFGGMNGKCMQTPWNEAFTAPLNSRLRAVETVDMAYYNPKTGSAPQSDDTGRQVIIATALVGGVTVAQVQICNQPDGEVYTAVPPATLARQPQTLPVLFRVSRSVNGTSRGQIREIIFPAGGTARAR